MFDPPEDTQFHKFSRSAVSGGKRVKDQTFGFDRVFDENTTQGDVYEATTRGLLDSVLDGYNATVFAYGATGCGKTHTITGTAQQPGIIFLTMQELFEKIEERNDEKHTEVSLSYLEIYNETIRDLLEPGGSKAGLMLREDANQSVSVMGLSSHHPRDVQQVMDMIVKGNEYRTISPTEANATSSRSHAVLQINLAQKDRNADINEPHTMATLSIIDLAGSERASATKNRGERLVEGANINKSLLALGSCINALCDPRKKNHVPYRNSKLTRLLKFSLGGNCKTVMIVCVSPSSAHFDETQNTLRYANRAKNIQTKVTRNVFNVNRHVKDFIIKIDEQRALIDELKAQQKDSETVAFAKFRKLSEKRDGIAKEGITRIRAAFENAGPERQDKTINMKKLRQLERRIGLLSSWIAAFDGICDSRESGQMPTSLAAMRKTAQGILLELENSRQHFHQKIDRINWERALDSALQNSIRQLVEVDGCQDGLDVASLTREAELLKANAQRESLREVNDQEKVGDAGMMQALLSAQFEVMSSLSDIMAMSEEEAVQHAKVVLQRLVQKCSTVAAQVIKPDGSMKIVETFPPTKRGTPKRKKPVADIERMMPPPQLAPLDVASQVLASPMKASPRRRKPVVGKKGVSFTPKKKSPSKRSVRWRDDTEAGALADYEKTPQKHESEPEPSDDSITLPALPSYLAVADTTDDSLNSSPIPTVPQSSLEIKAKSNRFQAGFLSKKSDGSPPPPRMTPLSSDDEQSPRRVLSPTTANARSSLSTVQNASSDMHVDSGNNSGSETESWQADRSESARISLALKRSGSVSRAGNHDSASRTQRRRSPAASNHIGSPPNENMFTASHARRMVKSDKEDFAKSVLSPRTQPVFKNNGTRRTTIGDVRVVSGGLNAGALRMNGTVGSGPRARESVVGLVGKNGWR